MSVIVTSIMQAINLEWDINAEEIIVKRMDRLLGYKDGTNAHEFRLYIKKEEEFVDLINNGLSATMFFRKASGQIVEIAGVVDNVIGTDQFIKFTLPNTVYEQGAFRADIRLVKAFDQRTIIIIEGNVL